MLMSLRLHRSFGHISVHSNVHAAVVAEIEEHTEIGVRGSRANGKGLKLAAKIGDEAFNLNKRSST